MELLEHVLTTLIENNIVINKKTPTRLSSFHISDDSLHSQNEVNNLIENNQEELNILILMKTAHYPITTLTLLTPTR